MLHLVIDNRIVINMLLLVGNDTSIEHALRPLSAEREVNAIAGHSVVEGDDIMIET